MWTVQTPHTHNHTEVGEHNYCRNPSAADTVWCFTTDPNKEREDCDVPFCDVGCQPSDWTPYSGEANTTISGRTCQMWSATTPNSHNHTYVGHHNFCVLTSTNKTIVPRHSRVCGVAPECSCLLILHWSSTWVSTEVVMSNIGVVVAVWCGG